MRLESGIRELGVESVEELQGRKGKRGQEEGTLAQRKLQRLV